MKNVPEQGQVTGQPVQKSGIGKNYWLFVFLFEFIKISFTNHNSKGAQWLTPISDMVYVPIKGKVNIKLWQVKQA